MAISFAVATVDAALGNRVVLIGLLIAGPCCVLLTGRWVPTALTSLQVIGLAVILGLPDGIWGSAVFFTWLGAVAAVALVSTLAAALIQAVRPYARAEARPAERRAGPRTISGGAAGHAAQADLWQRLGRWGTRADLERVRAQWASWASWRAKAIRSRTLSARSPVPRRETVAHRVGSARHECLRQVRDVDAWQEVRYLLQRLEPIAHRAAGATDDSDDRLER